MCGVHIIFLSCVQTHEELLSHFIEACNCSKKYLYEIQSVVNESWERPIDVISSCSAELDKKYLGVGRTTTFAFF